MDKDTKQITTVFIILLAVGVAGVISCWNDMQTISSRNEITKALIESKYPLTSASFNGAQVIIQTYSVNEFLSKAQAVNATVVYGTYYARGYVVTDNTFTYAYNLPQQYPFPSLLSWMITTCGFMAAFIVGWLYLQFKPY
jgi:hypothetical protein